MNRVEVYAGVNPVLKSAIDAPGASSVDLSGDGATLWVGTSTEELLSISTSSLQLSARYAMAGVSPIPGVVFNRPREALVLAGGKLALRLRESGASESLLALWDPALKVATDLTPPIKPGSKANTCRGNCARSSCTPHPITSRTSSIASKRVKRPSRPWKSDTTLRFRDTFALSRCSPEGRSGGMRRKRRSSAIRKRAN